MEYKKLNLNFIKPGEPLAWDVYDQNGKMLLKRGFVIADLNQAERLIERGVFADKKALEAGKDSVNSGKAPVTYNPFWLWEDLLGKLGKTLRGINKDGMLLQLEGLARLVQVLTARSPDAALASIILLLHTEKYPVAHSLHVAVLSNVLANRLNLSEPQKLSMIQAAFTMNLGMLDTQERLSHQNVELSLEQERIISEHSGLSVILLQQAGVSDQLWLSAVQEHHENIKGTGYPNKIKNPNQLAQLIRIADIFCAKISPRGTREPLSGTQAVQTIYADSSIDNSLAQALVKEIGMYPPGTFVKLASQELGVVHSRTSSVTNPIVYAVVNARGEPLLVPSRRDTANPEYKIVSPVVRKNIKVKLVPAGIWQ